MAELGTLITIADKVFQLFQSQALKDMQDWESDLGKLNKSVAYIKKMLLDADANPQLSCEEQTWIEELKEVLYDTDDLFDRVITIAKMKEFDDEGVRLLKKVLYKVCRFFSSNNRLLVSYYTSQEVKNIQLKLDAIAINHDRYNFNVGHEFKVDHLGALERRADTCSVLDDNIIGRDDDIKVIVDLLLDPNVEENVGFVVIVGIGGLGKTTLARLVYNHDTVETMFEKKLWVCVSDQDGRGLNVKAILDNIIELSRNEKSSEVSTMQSLQINLQKELKNKTYLLILDDVWTEDPIEWNELRKYLTIGGTGSKVVITTRSEKTAEIVLGKTTHSKKCMLEGLSPNDSWRLFMMTAFKLEPDKENDPKLIKIGKEIVTKCANVPLAIKVLGTLLNGQTHKWESFEKNRLPQIETTKNTIMAILKLSYDNLEPPMKNCFRYCALFPKSFEMDKRKLISLWMAQGYIGDSEDCVLTLLKLCFFQDVKKNGCGDVISFKMHDLMHDLAQEVAGDDIIVANSPQNILSKKIRHLFIDGGKWTKSSFHKRNFRTCYMNTRIHSGMVKILVENWRCLRSLRLYVPESENLSESIGELLHLRYLDLSENKKLKTLPNSIVKLYNLESLIMCECHGFNEWPKDFCKLVNLRLLDINDCRELTCMPLGIDQLINLRELTSFEVGGVSLIEEQSGGELKYLKSLVNLKGELNITVHGNLANMNKNVWEDRYLKHIKNLKVVTIGIPAEALVTNQEALITKLQPNRNLMQLRLYGYNGTEIPWWGRACDDWAFTLPNLVNINLERCERLSGIPLLSNLKHLKVLSLLTLTKLEYIEASAISHGSSRSKDVPFFPSLEYLTLKGLERLREWRKGVGESGSRSSSSKSHWLPFPCLSTLKIYSCPRLAYFPRCPSLESLDVRQSKNLLGISRGEGHGNLDIKNCSSSLQSLKFDGCRRLLSVLGTLEHLTALKSLSVENTDDELDFNDMPWRTLRHNLRSLKLNCFRTMQTLPMGMKYLTALQNLSISDFKSLEGLSEWMSCLSSLQSLVIYDCPNIKSLGTIQNITSLQKLDIKNCPKLREACKEPSGKEWPNIRHIPHFSISQ